MRLTPLQAAATNGHLAIVQLLLENGAAINRSTSVAPVRAPSYGAGGDEEDGSGQKEKFVAAVGGDEEGGITALKCACSYAQVAVAERLLAEGGALAGTGGMSAGVSAGGGTRADGDSAKGTGLVAAALGGSIFTHACNEGRQRGMQVDELDRAVASLISIIPEPDRSEHLVAVDARGTTALHAACERKLSLSALGMIQVLTSLGTDEPSPTDEFSGGGGGADGRGGEGNPAEGIKRRAQLGRLVDVANAKGATPLLLACQQALEETVRALVTAGADPRAVDKAGRTPLAIATRAKARSPRNAAIAALLEKAVSGRSL